MARKMYLEVFSTRDPNEEGNLKNINPTALPNFHGMDSYDPNTLMFEFFVVYKTFHYTSNEKNLKLFISTPINATLHWFMN